MQREREREREREKTIKNQTKETSEHVYKKKEKKNNLFFHFYEIYGNLIRFFYGLHTQKVGYSLLIILISTSSQFLKLALKIPSFVFARSKTF